MDRRTLTEPLGCATALALIAMVVTMTFGAWYAFKTLPIQVAAAMVAALGTIIVATITIVGSRYIERRMRIEQELRLKKGPLYEEFISFVFKSFTNEKLGRPRLTIEEQMEFFLRFTQSTIVWGSDGVIREYGQFRQLAAGNDDDALRSVWQVEKLLFEIRKDLGHDNRRLQQGDLLALFVNDIREQEIPPPPRK